MKLLTLNVGPVMGAAIAACLMCSAASVRAQEPADFQTSLMTAAFVPADGPFRGEGSAAALVDGDRIRLSGSFEGLELPATRIRVLSGLRAGVPGDRVIAELASSSNGTAGAFAGDLPATPENLSLLRQERLYVQIETPSAPDGALWGWLMEAHPFPGQNVPEQANPHAR